MPSPAAFPRFSFLQSCDYAGKEIHYQDEREEAVKALLKNPDGYNFDEVIINFDRKYTPFHQLLQICLELLEEGINVGEDVFLTPWIPSSFSEGPFRQLATLLSIMDTNAKLSKKINSLPLNNFLLSITSEENLFIDSRKRIVEILRIATEEFGIENRQEEFLLVPVFHNASLAANADSVVESLVMGSERIGVYLNKMRVGFDLSEMAMELSFIPAYLSTKLGIKKLKGFQEDSDYHFSVMLMGGSLPFRGNMSPENVDYLVKNFSSVETYVFPSSIIHNHSPDEIFRTFKILDNTEFIDEYEFVERSEEEEIVKISIIFGYEYQKVIGRTIADLYPLIVSIPEMRGRIIPTFEKYIDGKVNLKAFSLFLQEDEFQDIIREMKDMKFFKSKVNTVNFAAASYSIGLPPEIIAAGKAFKHLRKLLGNECIEKLVSIYFPGITDYYNKVLQIAFPELLHDLISKEILDDFKEGIDEISRLPGITMTSNSEYGEFLKESIIVLKKLKLGKKFNKKQINNIFIELGKMRGGLA